MATKIVSEDVVGNVKPSFASSSLVGLTVRANGEEATKVLDMNGNMVDAQFPAPTLAPVLATGTGSAMAEHNNKWAAYAYVYAATSRYPLVENDISIGGSLAPRGMPSPVATLQITDDHGVSVTMVAPPVDRPDLDQVWLFRTAFFDTEEEAQTSGEAGSLYFLIGLDVEAGGADVVHHDENPGIGTDQIEVDNFGIPTFRYVVYSDPFWWGWGNMPLSIAGSWATNGIITITDGTRWFNGRNNQYVKLEGVETGGIGDNGLWLFKWLSATTAQLTLADGTDATVADAGAGTIVIQGPPTTLYRSKRRNPFSWGYTEYLADGSRIPQVYAFKIGGGLGTAIAQVPSVHYLLLSTEYPAGTYTLDLRAAETTNFAGTLRRISNFYSITSHFSQFTATRQGRIVLWGWDAKNYCIVECDGVSINIVSEPVSKTLRQMTRDRSRQQLAHGAYDARNRMNCMWLPSIDSQSQVDMLLMHHSPTNQWFVHDDHDVLCSAQFQDGDTNLSKIYVGTETGLMGEAFADGFFADWVASGRSLGTCNVATNVITRNDSIEFYMDRDGYVGNWCLVTDLNGENEHWCRIAEVTADSLTFDLIRLPDGSYVEEFAAELGTDAMFYVGLIECRMRKYFNLGVPAEDKKLSEIWLTLTGTTTTPMTGHIGSTFLRYYRERQRDPFAPNTTSGLTGIALQRIKMDDAEETEVWFTQTPPTERIKTFGIEIIDRGLLQWRMYDWSLKVG